MSWLSVHISLEKDNQKDLLSDFLFSLDAHGVEESTGELIAYFDSKKIDSDSILEEIKNQPFLKGKSIKTTSIADENWNKSWESHYDPVWIEDSVYVRANFHPSQSSAKYELLIHPKMSFGTAHHPTTYLMVRFLLQMDVKGKKLLDFGCGTGILGILALKMLADQVTAIDIDEWAYLNAKENAALNQVPSMEIIQGDSNEIPDEKFDLILANVNRNVLLSNAHVLKNACGNKAQLILSGLLEKDEIEITNRYQSIGFQKLKTIKREGWIAIAMQLK